MLTSRAFARADQNLRYSLMICVDRLVPRDMNTEVRQSSTAIPLRGAMDSNCTDTHRGVQELRMIDLSTSLVAKRPSSSPIEVLPCPSSPESQQAWRVVKALEVRCDWLKAENTAIGRELQEVKVRAMENTAALEDSVFRLLQQTQHIYKPKPMIEPEGLNLVAPAKSRREPTIGRSLKRKHPAPSGDDVATHRCKRIRRG
jgi:hypothetical protein